MTKLTVNFSNFSNAPKKRKLISSHEREWERSRQLLGIYSCGDRWINQCGSLVEWYGQSKREVNGENTVRMTLYAPKIPHILAWIQTRAFTLRGWRLTETARKMSSMFRLLL